MPASVCVPQIAEMRSLKKEVHRQMQIHGDYKVSGEKAQKAFSTLSKSFHDGIHIVNSQGWYHREDIAKYARIQRQGDILNTETRVRLYVN